jgi:DNA-binding response OmpR family regulator
VDVTLLRWPGEEQRRGELAEHGTPRLLLVAADSPPPTVVEPGEDWVRLPASDDDVRARVRSLLARTRAVPILEDGVLVVGSTHLPLPPIEARLAEALLDRAGAVVARDQLARVGWPEGMPSRNALDVRILRLRRRVAGLGLAVRTVRHRGYLLEIEPVRNGSGSRP